MKTIGMRIRELRKTLNNGSGLKQSEFAEKLGVKHGIISAWELSTTEVNEKAIKAICYTFGVAEDWLKNGAGEMFIKSDTRREEELMRNFRAISPEVQELVLRYTETLLKNQQAFSNEKSISLVNNSVEDTYDKSRVTTVRNRNVRAV